MRTAGRDLFYPIVEAENMHVAFKALRASADHAGARALMNDFYFRMGDPNGNFIKDFQSEGFHSRMFEIACFAYLESQGFVVNHTLERPDFLVKSPRGSAAVEVVTANPTSGRSEDIAITALENLPFDEIYDKCQNDFPIRIGRALLAKLRMAYWSLPQCRDVPLILIVGPFHEPGSMTYTDESLARYMYGVERFPDWVERHGVLVRSVPVTHHEYDGKSLPSNFFGQPLSEHISAVIFSNSFTVPKFFRLSIQEGGAPGLRVTRHGVSLMPTSEGFEPFEFEYSVNDTNAPHETWWQGVTIFHNPNARFPILGELFAATSSFYLQSDQLRREVFDFHPLTSVTIGHVKPS